MGLGRLAVHHHHRIKVLGLHCTMVDVGRGCLDFEAVPEVGMPSGGGCGRGSSGTCGIGSRSRGGAA